MSQELLLTLFTNGALPRDPYWLLVQQYLTHLRHYQHFIRGELLDAIEIRADELVIRLKNGLIFSWQPEDLRTAPSVIVANGTYEIEILTMLNRLIARLKPAVILDIGANVGWYTLHFAQTLLGLGGSVYSFEPVPTTYAALRHNLRLNPALEPLVKLVPAALGEQPGEVTLHVPQTTGSVAASLKPLFPDQEQVRVTAQMTTIDTFTAENITDRIGLVKMDIEGAELFALRGGQQMIAEHRPVIMLEMLRKWSEVHGYHPNAIIELLKELDYTSYRAVGSGFEAVQVITEDETATNFFFLPSEQSQLLID